MPAGRRSEWPPLSITATLCSLAQEDRGALALCERNRIRAFFRILGPTPHLLWLGSRCAYRQSFDSGRLATAAQGGGIWGHSGVCQRWGRTCFVITGNTFTSPGDQWSGGEAIVRLQAGPIFTGQPTDFWAPTNWQSLDNSDTDLGGFAARYLYDVARATPSHSCSLWAKMAMLIWSTETTWVALPRR